MFEFCLLSVSLSLCYAMCMRSIEANQKRKIYSLAFLRGALKRVDLTFHKIIHKAESAFITFSISYQASSFIEKEKNFFWGWWWLNKKFFTVSSLIHFIISFTQVPTSRSISLVFVSMKRDDDEQNSSLFVYLTEFREREGCACC